MKSQMSLVIDILKALLGKEGNHTLFAAATLVTSLCPSGVISDQRQPQATNFLVQDSLLGRHPQPFLPRSPHQHPLPIPQPNQRNQVQNQKQTQIKTQVDPERKCLNVELILVTCNQLLPHLIQNGMVVPRFLPPMPTPHKPWYDENVRCEFHDGSKGRHTENCRDFQKLVQELINDKVLTFKKNRSIMDILITRTDNDDVKGSPKTLENSTYQMDVKTLKAGIEDTGAIINSSQNGQVIATRKLKEEIRSLRRKEIPESSKGQPPAVPFHYHPLESVAARKMRTRPNKAESHARGMD